MTFEHAVHEWFQNVNLCGSFVLGFMSGTMLCFTVYSMVLIIRVKFCGKRNTKRNYRNLEMDEILVDKEIDKRSIDEESTGEYVQIQPRYVEEHLYEYPQMIVEKCRTPQSDSDDDGMYDQVQLRN